MTKPGPNPTRTTGPGPDFVTGLLDAEVTCDYLVPLSVGVNVDTGAITHVELHLEGFQQAQPGWFVKLDSDGAADYGHTVALRQAFIDGDELADGESPLGDAALAIADRVDIAEPVALRWTLGPS